MKRLRMKKQKNLQVPQQRMEQKEKRVKSAEETAAPWGAASAD